MLKLTIGIPTFNGGDNLIRAINSCANIKLKPDDYEILIIDNHSDDCSIERVEELKKEFKNLNIIRNETNIGRIPNWNKCVDHAKGKYFIFLFSNDRLYENNNISEMISVLDKKGDIGLIISKYMIQTDKGQTLGRRFLRKSREVNTKLFLSKFLDCGLLPCGLLQSMIYRTDALTTLKFDDKLDYTTDQIVSINYAIKFPKIYFNNVPQFIFNTTAKRFHSSAKYLDKFKQVQNLIGSISLDFDKTSCSLTQKIKLYINYLKKVISLDELNKAKFSIAYNSDIFTYLKLMLHSIKFVIFLTMISIF
jgi:glycosyltransferase involved in cell wall biosynthesis